MTNDPWPPEGTRVRFRPYGWQDYLHGTLLCIGGTWMVRVPVYSMRFVVQRHEIEVIE